MNTSAIIMMIISMVFLWGGLILSILHLMNNLLNYTNYYKNPNLNSFI